MPHCFVPPYLLRRLAETDPDARGCARTLELDARFREGRHGPGQISAPTLEPAPPGPAVGTDQGAAWVVHSADNREELPGRRVRAAGDAESGDLAVDEAAAGVAASLALAADYGRSSFDGAGATVVATVHFGRDYVNAFWDGQRLVFGDGDGRIFERFTKPVDVLGHEFAHAVTERSAGLVYRNQPGALNESVADVFAACLRQRLLGQQAAEADWLIGVGLFRPGIQARGLRDMARPGTAYDDPRLGRDPQVGHLDDFVETAEDNGGVHLNSGIPNRAFQLAATAIGGRSWEGAGRVWWDALTGGGVRPTTDFAGFAAATVAAAGPHADGVLDAWTQVGVTPASSAPGASTGTVGDSRATPAPGSSDQLVVRRSGGFAGLTASAGVDLSTGDRASGEARALLDRIDFAAASTGDNRPDMYVYTFELPGREPVVVPQQSLTPELRRLAALVLGEETAEEI